MYACDSQQSQQQQQQYFYPTDTHHYHREQNGNEDASSSCGHGYYPLRLQDHHYDRHNGALNGAASVENWVYPPPPDPTQTQPYTATPTSRGYVAVSVITVNVGLVEAHYGRRRSIPMVARVTLIDHRSAVLLDTYVQPTHRITDYRTESTGLNYLHFQNAPTFESVQRATAKMIMNNVIVGHRLWEFLSVMGLSHPAIDTRDLALFRPLRKRLKSRCILDLRTLVRFFVGKDVGYGYEDSLENAIAAMELFRVCHPIFEGIVEAGAWPCDLPPVSYSRHFL
ncbi:MipD protein [Coprinopsis cinerea AmutBmut pab1-1]|nr:MipD protein [Coprinopsis cinerea AmutBmut pab1-1]